LRSIARSLTVKAQDVGQHPPEARRNEIASLREYTGEAGATPLKGAVVQAGRKRHVTGGGLNTQSLKPGLQARISAVIKNNKASIDRKVSALYTDLLGMGMATQTVVGFKDSDLCP
jgi:hypothetical protein